MRKDLLDHGYLELCEAWGSDEDIIRAARQSTQKGFIGWGGWTCRECGTVDDTIRDRLGEDHPVGACGHGSYSDKAGDEKLLRYLWENNYVPTVERMLEVSRANRQAGAVKGATELDAVGAFAAREFIDDTYKLIESVYQKLLSRGVPKEVTRVVLPVGRYSTMRASTDLRNWLGFLDLRMAPNAQYEIRMYANALHDMLAEKFPRTLALFDESRAK